MGIIRANKRQKLLEEILHGLPPGSEGLGIARQKAFDAGLIDEGFRVGRAVQRCAARGTGRGEPSVDHRRARRTARDDGSRSGGSSGGGCRGAGGERRKAKVVGEILERCGGDPSCAAAHFSEVGFVDLAKKYGDYATSFTSRVSTSVRVR